MPSSRLPLLMYGAGALLVVAGVAAVYWPAALVVAGLVCALTAIDFGAGPSDGGGGG